MVRTAFAMAFVLLAACGKDVEDPGFTASASATMTSAGTSTSAGETSSSGATSNASNSGNNSDSADVSTGDPSAGTSGPTSDTDSGNGGCGDGAISPGEQCDGAELQGFTCMSLGLNGGTLACDPVMCTFDTSMCMSTSGGTSG